MVLDECDFLLDDEPGSHHVAVLALSGVPFKDLPLELVCTHFGAQALERLTTQPDADVFDALTRRRVYKPTRPIDPVLPHIQGERSRHFDPNVVDACFARFEETDRLRREDAD